MADIEKAANVLDLMLTTSRTSLSETERDAIRTAVELLKKHEAKWVEDKQDEHCRLIKCSNCGLTFIVGNNIPYDEWIEDRNYCLRCGARMVKWE